MQGFSRVFKVRKTNHINALTHLFNYINKMTLFLYVSRIERTGQKHN